MKNQNRRKGFFYVHPIYTLNKNKWNETTIFNTWKISYHFLNFVRFQNSFKLFFHSIGHPRSISRYSRKICIRKGREKKERRRSEGSLPPRKQGMSIRDLMTFGQRRGREKGFLPVSINGGAATKGAARKSFGSFQPSSRPLVEKERRERGSTARKDVEQWKAARRYKPLIINPLLRSFFRLASFLPSPPSGGTKNETERERAILCAAW